VFYLSRASLFLLCFLVFLAYFLLFVLRCQCAKDCLEGLVSEMTCCVQRDVKLYLLTHSLNVTMTIKFICKDPPNLTQAKLVS